MNPAESLPAGCWSCGRPIDATDAFCRHCGMGQSSKLAWYYEIHWMALLALFALGPFVLPLIWKSPRLGPRGRLIATALTGLMTVYFAYSCWKLFSTLAGAWSGAVL